MIEDPQISFRVPQPLKERLVQVAENEMLSVSDVIRKSVVGTIKTLEEKHHSDRPTQWSVLR